MIKAVRDTVILEVKHLDTIGAGRIHLPDVYGVKSNVMDYYGVVIDVGPECRLDIKKGDKVLFQRNEGHPIKTGDFQEFISISPKWIEGRITDEA